MTAPTQDERLLSIFAARRSGDVEALVRALDDPDYRDAAARGLGNLRAKAAVDSLVCLLSDRDNKTRLAAVLALREIGDPRAVVPLIKVMARDNDDAIRGAAAAGLGQIGDARAVPALIDQLTVASPVLVRMQAVDALGKIGDPRALAPLTGALAGERWLVRRQIKRAIRAINR